MSSALNRNRVRDGIICASLFLALQGLYAAPREGRAVVTAISGSVEYQLVGENTWQAVRVGMALSETTIVRTATQSSVDLALTTGSIIRLASSSRLRFSRLSQETPPGSKPPAVGGPMIRHSKMMLERGQALVMAGKQGGGSTFRIDTPFGPVDVKGTSLVISLVGNDLIVRCVEGGPVTFLVGGQLFTIGQGQQITGTVALQTGQVTISGQPASAPTNDSLAAAFNQFQQNQTSSGIASIVFNLEGPVNLDQLMQAIASQTQGWPPAVVIVGPSTASEVSVSTP